MKNLTLKLQQQFYSVVKIYSTLSPKYEATILRLCTRLIADDVTSSSPARLSHRVKMALLTPRDSV